MRARLHESATSALPPPLGQRGAEGGIPEENRVRTAEEVTEVTKLLLHHHHHHHRDDDDDDDGGLSTIRCFGGGACASTVQVRS